MTARRLARAALALAGAAACAGLLAAWLTPEVSAAWLRLAAFCG